MILEACAEAYSDAGIASPVSHPYRFNGTGFASPEEALDEIPRGTPDRNGAVWLVPPISFRR
jgi:hypothetical protein